jgi:maleylacetoacetate isomerase
MLLYSYFRSSAAYRVRIALNLKGLAYEYVPVHLVKAEHRAAAYMTIHPQGLVPALRDDGGILTQSLAIIEYLDETHPQPPLLPSTPAARARVRAIALLIACEIHPVNNLRVLQYLARNLGVDEASRNQWYRHWVSTGFDALEGQLAGDSQTGRFCHGETPTVADVCLVPQVANARRYEVPMDAYPTIARIDAACRELPAFADAAPERQPDAE